MFASNLTLANASSVNKTFVLIDTQGQTLRVNNALPASTPEALIIKHQRQGSKENGWSRRHLVSAQITKLCADGLTRKTTLNITIEQPEDAVFTQAVMDDLKAYAFNFLNGSGNYTSILLGES